MKLKTRLKAVAIEARREFELKEIDRDLLSELYLNYTRMHETEKFLCLAAKMFPRLNCGLASVYLRFKLGDGQIIRGKFRGHAHTFLQVEDLIVDITADQYGGPSIYVGPLTQAWTFSSLT